MRSDDHFVVMTDVQVSSAGPVRATSSWAEIPRDQKFQGAECAGKSATVVRNIQQPAFQLHPDDHAQHLNDELVRAVTECFPLQKSPTGHLPRRSLLSARSLTLMD
eukprot:3640711-Pyramimonas_sp.AAC.1